MGVNNFLSLKKEKVKYKKFYLKTLNQRRNAEKNNIDFIIDDARNYHNITRIIENLKQVTYHLAAVAHANVSNKDPYTVVA